MHDKTEPVTVREVVAAFEKTRIYEFRYRIYVDEMQRRPRHADHALRIISDPLDATARIFAAFAGDEVVGTVRLNAAWEGDLGGYPELYQMLKVGGGLLVEHAVASGLMVAAPQRRSGLAVRLAQALVRAAIAIGARYVFLDCNAPLVRFYERLGARCHLPTARHPDYGEVTVLCLDVRDTEHLERLRSPLLAVRSGRTLDRVPAIDVAIHAA